MSAHSRKPDCSSESCYFASAWATRIVCISLLLLLLSWISVSAIAGDTASDIARPTASIGLNKFDLLMQYLGTASGGDGSAVYRHVTRAMARKALDDARDISARLMRVSISGFAPSIHGTRGDLDLWRTSPAEFWSHVDMMLDDLDTRNIRLVAVLMWNLRQFPAMTGETVADLIRKPESASWRMLASFSEEFVRRYRGRKTILFYELSNELNLMADLDNVRRCDRVKREKLCDVAGNFSTNDMINFTKRFAEVIRKANSTTPISSGFSIPRSSAAHLRARPEWHAGGPDWTPDSREEFGKYLKDVHSAVDIISIHLYDQAQNRRFGSPDSLDLLETTKRISDQAKKLLFIGEFGEPEAKTSSPKSFSNRLINRVSELRIPYSAVWVWQFYQRRTYITGDKRDAAFSLEPGYTDFLIDRIRTANMGDGSGRRFAGSDTSPPRLVLTWPLECARVRAEQKVHAVASDDSGRVERVEFWLNDKRLASDTSPPYETLLRTTTLSRGVHKAEARAYDFAGNVASWITNVVIGQPPPSGQCALADK